MMIHVSENKAKVLPCHCRCRYICGRGQVGAPVKCALPITECMEQHWKKDCDHDFSGPMYRGDDFSSVTCVNCGVLSIDHDMVVGP